MATMVLGQRKGTFGAGTLAERIGREVIGFLAPSLRSLLEPWKESMDDVEEIRLRVGQPLLLKGRRRLTVSPAGVMTERLDLGYAVKADEVVKTIQAMSEGSVYAREEELRQGFLTLPGGHRVGLAGKVLLEGGRVRTLKHVGSLNIRLARQFPGVATAIVPCLLDGGRVLNTLILSPPGCGKTTLLRDIIRQLSRGRPDLEWPGASVGVVDERSEIAACYEGVAQNDVGPQTDILDGCPKGEGLTMLIRSMGPEVIAVDELGRPEDAEALADAGRAGVAVLATAHGSDFGEALGRPLLGNLIREGYFQRVVVLGRTHGPGTVEAILDGRGQRLRGRGEKL